MEPLESQLPMIHEHVWQPAGIVEEDEFSYDLAYARNHQVRTKKYAIRMCACGETDKVLVVEGKWRYATL